MLSYHCRWLLVGSVTVGLRGWRFLRPHGFAAEYVNNATRKVRSKKAFVCRGRVGSRAPTIHGHGAQGFAASTCSVRKKYKKKHRPEGVEMQLSALCTCKNQMFVQWSAYKLLLIDSPYGRAGSVHPVLSLLSTCVRDVVVHR